MIKKLIILAIIVIGLYFFGRTLVGQLFDDQVENVQGTVEEVNSRIDEARQDVQGVVDGVSGAVNEVEGVVDTVNERLNGDSE